jgi:hypothetical protein
MTKVNAKVTKAQTAIIDALTSRANSAENDNQRKNLTAELKFYNAATVEYAMNAGINVEALAKQIAQADKKHADFLAVYALQKVRKILNACAQGIANTFDPYTRTILANLSHNKQNNKTALVSLSKSVTFDEFDTQHAIKARYNCNASTASTQASSTRQALRVLNIANTSKGRVNDEFELTDSALAKRVIEIFTVKKAA